MTYFEVRSRVMFWGMLGALMGALVMPACGGSGGSGGSAEPDDGSSGGSLATGGTSFAGGGDGGETGGSAGEDDEECLEDLMPEGAAVRFTAGPEGESAPEPQGGELVDGTYDLTSIVAYAFDPEGTEESRVAVRIRAGGTRLDFAEVYAGGWQGRTYAIHPIEPGSVEMTLHYVCPWLDEEGASAEPYTATADRIQFFHDQGTTVLTYERRAD